jgi:hypothetical protein
MKLKKNLKTKLNKLVYKNNFSVCQRRKYNVATTKNYLIQCDNFSIETNTWRWPTEAETCCEEEKR